MASLALRLLTVRGIPSGLYPSSASLRLCASAVLAMHNHAGARSPKPSEQDREVTYRLRDAGRILGIEVVDHILIGEERFYSFQEHFFR